MLSIIIPTLNEEKYLPNLLKSIKKQEFIDYEIIVSDGGSQDKTIKIAEQYDCRVIIDSEHHHPSWQRNNGAKIAKGQYLLFLDADSVLQDNFLQLTVDEFVNRRLTVAGFYIKFNPNRPIYSIYSFFFNIFLFLRQYYLPSAVGAGIMATREEHQHIQGFDVSILLVEDYDYCQRLAKQGKFRMIKSQKLLYSSRRLESEGKFITLLRWLKMGIFTCFNLKIRKKVMKYDFGKF